MEKRELGMPEQSATRPDTVEISTEIRESEAKKWGEYAQELAEVRDSVIQKARKTMGDKGGAWFMQKMFNFGSFIRENNRDYAKYVAYHKLASSTTTRTESPKLDFPAPYNVKDFLMRLSVELSETEEIKEWIEYMLGLKYDWKNEIPEEEIVDNEEKHKIRKKWFTCVNLSFDWVMRACTKKQISISPELFHEMEEYQDTFMASMAARRYESNGKKDMDQAGDLLDKVLAELILNQKI